MEEVGFSENAKAVGTLAAILGFTAIFQTDLGNVALKSFGFDDITKTTKQFLKSYADEIETAVAEKLGQTAATSAAKLNLA
ncbi:MAG: hypothetical protein Nk1A_7850 [Endomicrobiia bacterium]|nr:MAG: hypothetical protein Nk1A_7850 [Endomicrobiia bacterium]